MSISDKNQDIINSQFYIDAPLLFHKTHLECAKNIPMCDNKQCLNIKCTNCRCDREKCIFEWPHSLTYCTLYYIHLPKYNQVLYENHIKFPTRDTFIRVENNTIWLSSDLKMCCIICGNNNILKFVCKQYCTYQMKQLFDMNVILNPLYLIVV